jgi:hypothetical protein
MIGNKRNKEESAEQNADAKETQRTLYGFRAVYVFDRLSRDLWPSLCAPDAIHEWHFRRSPDSSRYIIAQLLCSMQRSLMQGSSYLHLLPTNPGF